MLTVKTLPPEGPHCAPGEASALLPVVGMMLQFSPAELKRCQDALAASEADAPADPAAAAPAAAATGAGDAGDYGLLTGWTSWAFGGAEEGKPAGG